MRLEFHQSAFILATTLITSPALEANRLPPFCVMLQLPPASCEAEKAAPCTGACPSDTSNNPPAWRDYWKRCQPQQSDLTIEQKRFMCDAPQAGELHIVYLVQSGTYACCTKNPFSGDQSVKTPKADDQKQNPQQ